jgi:ribonucleoside-diphosphate reductase beta chain
MDEPAIARRIEYFNKMDRIIKDEEEFFRKAVLFSMFIENVSLFSQFLIMMSFNKYRNALKGISNAVEATSKEEDIHARFGFEIVNLIKEENPQWWTKETQAQLYADTQESYEAEMGIIDWIYNGSDLDFLPKQVVKEFVADRFNQSLKAIGLEPMFDTDTEALKHTAWFVEETLSTKNIDFFVKRSVAYSKKLQSFTEDDLF